MTTQDRLPAHLDRLGRELTAAAQSLHERRSVNEPYGWRHRLWATVARMPRVALAGGGAGAAAAIAAVLVVASAGAPPAYALTTNANGTYTITINNIDSGIPALNAKLKQLGIDTIAVPVTTDCSTPNQGVPLLGGWPSSTPNQTVTLDQAAIPAGSEGVIAAYRSPSGGIDLTLATTTGTVPSCLNANDVTANPSGVARSS